MKTHPDLEPGDSYADLDPRSLHILADHLDELLWMRDAAGQLSFVSRQSLAVLGASPQQLLADPDLWLHLVPAEWQHTLAWLDPARRLEHSTCDEYPLRTDRGERWVQESCFPVRDSDGRLLHVIGATRDITRRRRVDQAMRLKLERAHELALRDPLTGLLNRRGLEHAAQALATVNDDHDTSVLLIDCDDFKRINDLHGHDVGDEVLIQIAACAKRQLRPTDSLGRLGGDEFLAVLPHTRLGEALRIAERITGTVERLPIACGGRSLSATISIGAGTLPHGCPTIGAALASADASLLASKRIGKNRVVARPEVLPIDRGRLGGLAPAGPPRLRTLAQPICRLDDLSVVGHETFTRGPLGCESAGFLFAIAASQRSIPQTDWMCLESSVAAAPSLAAGAHGPLPLHVNVWPATVTEIPMERWSQLSQRVPGGIVLEIPEQQLVGAPLSLRERFCELREFGFRIALDGLGYGRGSLEALLLLEPDLVKVDRHLVQDADRNAGRARTLARLLAVVRGLDLPIVAVGIETEAELTTLRGLGYTLGQGFRLGRPTAVRSRPADTVKAAGPP